MEVKYSGRNFRHLNFAVSILLLVLIACLTSSIFWEVFAENFSLNTRKFIAALFQIFGLGLSFWLFKGKDVSKIEPSYIISLSVYLMFLSKLTMGTGLSFFVPYVTMLIWLLIKLRGSWSLMFSVTPIVLEFLHGLIASEYDFLYSGFVIGNFKFELIFLSAIYCVAMIVVWVLTINSKINQGVKKAHEVKPLNAKENDIVLPKVKTIRNQNLPSKHNDEVINLENDMSEGGSGVLESIVQLMHKISCNPNSSLAFISKDKGKTFVLDSWVTRINKKRDSQDFRPKKGVKIYVGQNFIGKAIESGPYVLVPNLLDRAPNSGEIEYFESNYRSSKSLLIVPIFCSQNKYPEGILILDDTNERTFSNTKYKEELIRFSKIAGELILNQQRAFQLNQQIIRVQNMNRITKELLECTDLPQFIKLLTSGLQDVIPCDRVVYTNYNAKERKGMVRYSTGKPIYKTDSKKIYFSLTDENCLYSEMFKKVEKGANHPVSYCSEIKNGKYRFTKEIKDDVSSLLITPITDENGLVISVIGIETIDSRGFGDGERKFFENLTLQGKTALSKISQLRKLERLATIDGLTNIPNHRHFQDILDNLIISTKDSKLPFSLLLLDIDHFKNFNDTYGHQLGDLVLKQVAKSICKNIRQSDLVARYGGEEFVVILPGIGEDTIKESAERVRKGIESLKIPSDSGNLQVTVSIGGSIWFKHAEVKAKLIECADQAMYLSKEGGRNQYSEFKS